MWEGVHVRKAVHCWDGGDWSTETWEHSPGGERSAQQESGKFNPTTPGNWILPIKWAWKRTAQEDTLRMWWAATCISAFRREPSCAIPDFWTVELWDNEWVFLSYQVCGNLLHNNRKLVHILFHLCVTPGDQVTHYSITGAEWDSWVSATPCCPVVKLKAKISRYIGL